MSTDTSIASFTVAATVLMVALIVWRVMVDRHQATRLAESDRFWGRYGETETGTDDPRLEQP